MGDSEGKGFGRERASRIALLLGVVLFLVIAWGGLAWLVFQLFGL